MSKTGLAACLLLAASAARANMTVYPMSAMIDETRQEATTLQVISKSEATQYVRVTVKRISRPATPYETEETPVGDPGIVVSPDKFALSAGVTRTVRIISLRTPEKEEAWRVYFEPVPTLDDGAEQPKETTRVNVNLVWGVLVRLMPAEQRPELLRSSDGSKLINKGNLRYGVLRVAQCANEDNCNWKKVDTSVYPGEELALPSGITPAALRVEYRLGASAPTTATLVAGASLK